MTRRPAPGRLAAAVWHRSVRTVSQWPTSSTSPLPADWERPQRDGAITTSTRGRSLAEEGFIHCSFADQVAATAGRFFGDLAEVVVLRIDPTGSTSPLVVEDLVGSGESFPHVYGPIDVAAVADVRRVVTPRRLTPVRASCSARPSVGAGRPPRRRSAGLLLGPLLLLQRRLLGHEALEAGEAIGVEAAVVDRRPHGAAGLLVVLAVPEPALVHQVEHVGERPLDALARTATG